MGCAPERQRVYLKSTMKEGDFKSKKLDCVGPFCNQSIENFDQTMKKYDDASLARSLIKAFYNYNDQDCLAYREIAKDGSKLDSYYYFSYKEVHGRATKIAQSMRKLNLYEEKSYNNEKESFKIIGIFAKNCVEWAFVDFACMLDSLTNATFYSTLGEESFKFIAEQCNISTLFIDTENIPKFLSYKKAYGLESIVNIVLFDISHVVTKKHITDLQDGGVSNVLLLSDLINGITEEDKKTYVLKPSDADTVLTICYTSGTTGIPKGVKLTHRNFAAQAVLLQDAEITMSRNTRHLSYLPLAHSYERLFHWLVLLNGGIIAYISGEAKVALVDDMRVFKPTILAAVPRVLEHIRQTILDSFKELGGLSKSIADSGLESKRKSFKETMSLDSFFYDSLVFSKVRSKFGGALEFITCGAAPLPEDLATDIQIMLGVPVIEGYGMTENTAVMCVTMKSDLNNGYVGGPISSCMMKLEKVEDLGYSKDTKIGGISYPSGEICVRGPIVFPGYFCNPDETSKSIDDEGWLHTGDIGQVLPNMTIKIIDRVKEIFKLSQGEYITPAKLESLYSQSTYVSQIWVYGDSTKNHITAVIYPNKKSVLAFLKGKDIVGKDAKIEDSEKLFNSKEVIEEMINDFAKIAKDNKLNSLEKLNRIIISKEEFSFEKNNLLTPTMKLKRKAFEKYFSKEIAAIYLDSE